MTTLAFTAPLVRVSASVPWGGSLGLLAAGLVLVIAGSAWRSHAQLILATARRAGGSNQ